MEEAGLSADERDDVDGSKSTRGDHRNELTEKPAG